VAVLQEKEAAHENSSTSAIKQINIIYMAFCTFSQAAKIGLRNL
jgi:hypothetical protein